jgi:hypothetical protein
MESLGFPLPAHFARILKKLLTSYRCEIIKRNLSAQVNRALGRMVTVALM